MQTLNEMIFGSAQEPLKNWRSHLQNEDYNTVLPSSGLGERVQCLAHMRSLINGIRTRTRLTHVLRVTRGRWWPVSAITVQPLLTPRP